MPSYAIHPPRQHQPSRTRTTSGPIPPDVAPVKQGFVPPEQGDRSPAEHRANRDEQRLFGRNPHPQAVCQATRRDGLPCQAFVHAATSAFCLTHAPELAEAIAA